MNIPDELINIANEARLLTEKFASKIPYPGDPGDLQGYCAIGSTILMHLAIKNKYRLFYVLGNYSRDLKQRNATYCYNHCWNEWEEFIIDITATQFNVAEKVSILSKKEAIHYYPIKRGSIFVSSFESYVWNPVQNPYSYMDELKSLGINL